MASSSVASLGQIRFSHGQLVLRRRSHLLALSSGRIGFRVPFTTHAASRGPPIATSSRAFGWIDKWLVPFDLKSIVLFVCLCRYRLGEILASGGRNGRRTASGTALERHIRFGTFTSSSIVIFIASIFYTLLYYKWNVGWLQCRRSLAGCRHAASVIALWIAAFLPAWSWTRY